MFKVNSSMKLKIIYLLLVILSFSQVLTLKYINILVCVSISIIMLLSSCEECTTMLFLLLPFFNFFNYKMGTTSLYYIFTAIFIWKYIKYYEFKVPMKKIVILLFLAVIRMFCFNAEIYFKWLCLFTVLVLTYNEDFFIENIKETIENFSISFIISSAVGLYMLQTGSSLYTYTKSYVNGSTRFAGLIGDNVFFAQIALVLAAFNFIILYKRFSLKNLLIVISLYIFASLTISKTAIILEVILLILFLILLILKYGAYKYTFIKSIIIMILIGIGIFFSAYYIRNNTDNLVIQNYSTRFASNDLSTGRDEITNHYINKILQTPQVWFCSMTYEDYSQPFYPNAHFTYTINRSHNIYIETICCFGIIPSCFIFIWLIKRIILLLTQNKILVLPIITIFLTGFTLHGHYEFHYYLILSLGFSVFNKKFYKKLN